jgi:ABC-type sugar transport system substrate-binding protein
MINSGVKGLVVSAQDAVAAKPIVEFATSQHVPVFTADADINSPNVKMYVGFSGERAGKELTQRLVDYLKSKHNGEVKGTVLEMMGPMGGASSIDRSKGFHDVIDQYPNVKVIQAVGDFQEAPGKTAALNVLRANPHIDAVYSANGPMAVGAVEAMKDLAIDPTKVFTVTIDATPGVLTMIKSGDIQMALDQAPGFYTAIAAHYLVQYLERGDSALPKVGDTITAKDLTLSTGVKHAGQDIWADNSAWAPAKITTEFGHLWFQTGAVLVTKDNADSPTLWANIKLPPKA